MQKLTGCLLLALLGGFATKAQDQTSPNIILIVADDLGYKDLSAYGSPLMETPHLDWLAREGIRFTRGYAAAPLCSPTRASIVVFNVLSMMRKRQEDRRSLS